MFPLSTADGAMLQGQVWPAAAQAPPRGTLLIVHGLGEHMGRYAKVADHLAARGWRVVAHDQRGHGRSGGPRGGIPAADSLLADLARVIDALRAGQAGRLVLLGHSMGGLVAARFVAEGLAGAPAAWRRPVDGLVLSSPALDLGMTAMQRGLLAVMGRLAPDFAVANGLDPAWVSRDASVVAAYRADPLVHNRVTARLVRFMLDGAARVQRAAPAWAVPSLLLYAGADRCVAPAGSARWAAAAPAAWVQAQCFEGLFHEIFNEPERDRVLARLDGWLDALEA